VLLRLVSPWSSKLRGCRGEIEAMVAAAGEWERLTLGERYALTRAVCLRMPPSETRQGSQSVVAKMGLLVREVWPPTRPWEVMKVWAGLPRLASEFAGRYRPGAKAVVFGHTHRAALWRRGGRWLVNTGGFVTFSRPWRVTWDGEGMVIERIRVKGGAFGVEGRRVLALG
jgi:exonuclease SbcD